MLHSWRYAQAMYDPTQLKNLDISTLSVAACAVLGGLLRDVPEAAGLRRSIADRLQRLLQTEKIQMGDIGLLALVIDGLQACAPGQIEADTTMLFIRRLVACEAGIGGPYRSDEAELEVDPAANACVVQCLDWLAAIPDNSLAFLTMAMPELEVTAVADWGLAAALEQQVGIRPVSVVSKQLLDHLSVLTAATCLHIMRSAEAHLDDDRTADMALARDIHAHCLRNLPQFSQPFETNTRQMLQELIRVDTNHEISQLAWYYGDALADKNILQVSGSQPLMYLDLGAANMYAWAAYTIYDDFLDDEGQPTMLGTANYTFRAMVRHYQRALPNDPAFQKFVEHCLTLVDEANTLETTFYRLPVAGNSITIQQLPDFNDGALLADRALFHILGPMAVLAHTGLVHIGDSVWDHTLQAFRHYLIARQLNDDVHDWVKDLQAGQASYVVVELFRYLNVTPGTYNISQLLPYAREQFWQHVLPLICNIALEHIARARSDLQQGLQLTNNNAFIGLFDYVEDSMLAAQKKRAQSQALVGMFNH